MVANTLLLRITISGNEFVSLNTIARLDSGNPRVYSATVLILSKLKYQTQPQRNVLKYFAIFKNAVHSLEPGETPSYQAPNYVQRS